MRDFLYYILVILIFANCTPKQEDAFLNIKTTSLTFSAEKGSETIPFTGNVSFTALPSEEWCSVKIGESNLTISVDNNENTQQRTATVSVSAGSVPDISIDIKQYGTEPYFDVSANQKSQHFDYSGESRLLTVSSNIEFMVHSAAEWCKTEIQSGSRNNLRITAEQNETVAGRNTEVTISAEGFDDFVVQVSQDGYLPNKQGMNVKGWCHSNNTGIAGVVVSDGDEVTVTDADGIYYLSSKKRNSYVFISVPGNYEVPLKGKVPQFYKELNEEENVVERCDFELTPVDNDNHTLLVMTDIHLANRINDLVQFESCLIDINNVIAEYEAEGTKVYTLTLGDLSWDSFWYTNNFTIEHYVQQMNRINSPVFNAMGNHDHDPYGAGDWLAERKYIKHLGPNYYSFNLGNIHYVVLDNTEYINTGGAPGVSGSRNYNARFVKEQIEWLKKDLEYVKDKDVPLVIGFHIQLFNAPDVNNNVKNFRVSNSQEFIDCLADFSNVHILTGHTHYNYNYVYSDAVMEHNIAALCATWWWTGSNGYAGNHICKDGTVGGYNVWEIDNTNVEWYYKSVGYERDYQFRTYDLNSIEITAKKYAPMANATYSAKVPEYAGDYAVAGNKNEVLINVWGYDKEWTVSVTENGTELPVTRVAAKDPLHVISYEIARLNRNAEPSSTFVSNNTSHFFKVKASSPNSTLLIKVTDRFGNVYSETMSRPKDLTTKMR